MIRTTTIAVWWIATIGITGCSRMASSGTELTKTIPSLTIETGPPSNQRPWKMEQAVLPYADLDASDDSTASSPASSVTIHNVREARWTSETKRAISHADWTFDWDQVEGVDFVVVPFEAVPMLSHTMLSFRLDDGRALVISVEARLERGETYSTTAGAVRQFELMYVIGDEQDLYGLRAGVRGDDMFLYPTTANAAQAADLLRGILERANQLCRTPEYYDSLLNNCTTNILDHVLRLRAGDDERLRVLDQLRSRFPANSDRMAYDLGLFASELPFEQTRQRAWISTRVRQHLGDPDFSIKIRQDKAVVRSEL